MKSLHLFRVTAALCVALMLGSASSWAKSWNYSKTGVADDGGGSYDFRYDQQNFKYDGKSHWNAEEHIMWFKTQKKFDAAKGNYYYEFELAGCFIEIAKYGKSEWTKTYIEGEMYVVSADGSEHRIGMWNKPKSNESAVVYTSDENNYGALYVSSMNTSNGHFTVRYLAGSDAVAEGVNKIYLRQRLTFKDSRVWDWWQYEKAIDLTGINDDHPLPPLTADWGDDGKLHFTAADINATAKTLDYCYWLRFNFLQNDVKRSSVIGRLYRADESVSITEKPVNKEDMQFATWLKSSSWGEVTDISYTTPVYVYYRASHKMDVTEPNCGTTGWHYTGMWYVQPYLSETILPFTRPEKVNVAFDKWKKTNTITWTKREKAVLYDGAKRTDVKCRVDGRWYVIRYDRDKTAKDYVRVGQPLRGDAETLQVEDTDIEYDKEYTYRVVFLPRVLEDKYGEDLVNLPGQKAQKSDTNLWNEAWTSTLMEVPVRLWQDRTDDTGIHLVWEYNVQAKGCEWRLEKHRLGATTWNTVTTISVDTKQSAASYVEQGGSVCDLFTYRIMTTINGKALYSDTLVCNLPAGAYISNVRATTGSEEKNVVVKWKVARPGDDDIWFRILRRPIGSDEWTLLDDEMHGHATEYTYIDDRVMAGSYYEYSVEAYGAQCDGQLVQTDRQIAPGFSQARGNITGHISYGTGTAVAGVKVNLVKSSADESSDQPQFLSRYIEGEGKGLQWTADAEKYADKLCGRQELTLQLWAKPSLTPGLGEGSGCTLLQLANALELGIVASNGTGYCLYAADLSGSSGSKHTFPDLVFDPYKFTHIAAVYRSGRWTFYAGAGTLLTATMDVADTGWRTCPEDGGDALATLSIGGSIGTDATPYSGFVDDIRLWQRALSLEEIAGNYTRILGGTENGLVLYWPLDEGIGVRNYVFDVACQDGIYQLNHPEVGINATPSATVPEGLGLYGLTDIEGDYIIRGVPFQQGGTNYKLVPAMGTHEFSPNTRSMFVSPTSLTANNIDFEDVSSFPMSGHIYYAGTNVPAEGILFYIDGNAVTANGEMKQTDSDGYYEISVPIGNHYVEAKLDGHKMVSGGRFPTRGTFNFDRAVQYDFADSTLVNFVGRISGGERNDTLAVGFGASNNNIGMATITLKLNNESFSFNCKDDHISDATAPRTWESDTTGIASRAWTGTGYDSKYICIRTDSLTGEFSALIPPLKYVTKSIRVDSNLDLEFTSLPEIDLTVVNVTNTDSLLQETAAGDSVFNRYTYHTKMVRTHFAKPEIRLWQSDNSEGAFGLKEYEGDDVYGSYTVTDLWEKQADGSIRYRFNYPIIEKGQRLKFHLRGFEAYENRDGGVVVTDTIPLRAQVLTVENEMSIEQNVMAWSEDTLGALGLRPGEVVDLKSNQIVLDKDGRAIYDWMAGLPSVTKPYTRQLNSHFVRRDRTYVGPEMNAIVVGDLPSGNNFVTNGPDRVLMVLHDPPGAKSQTVWKRGTTKTKIRTSSSGGYGDEKTYFEANLGFKLHLFTGGMFLSYSTTDVDNTTDLGIGAHATWRTDTNHEQTWSLTTTEAISTGTGPIYVGAAGDVFVGLSSNMLLGATRVVGFFRENGDADFELREHEAMSIRDSVTTKFAYSAYELETVMIPKWKDMRRDYLSTYFPTKAEALAFENLGNEVVYATWYRPDDPLFGGDTTYVQVVPKNWDWEANPVCEDKVLWCNSQIRKWERQLELNEEDKVTALSDRDKYWVRNISFDGGSGYSFTERCDTTNTKKHTTEYSIGGLGKIGTQNKVAGTGFQYKTTFYIDTDNGYHHSETESDYNENTSSFAEFDYVMDDGNRDTDFSVDILNSPAGHSKIFSLFGGQSYNPHEPEEVTKYFEPGKHVLSNGTQRMEMPEIRISADGITAGKTATLTDVPAGQAGQFTLILSNNSKANMGFEFCFNIVVQEKADTLGLQVLMDGVPANGRGVYLPRGETIKKVITVRQTDQSVLDYEGIEILMLSQYQPLVINDMVRLNVHFKPSSSPIDMAINDPVLNIETLGRNNGDLELKLTNFDRQFKGMKRVGVEYRYEGSTTWAQPDTLTFVVNPADSTRTIHMLPKSGDLRLRYNMSNDNLHPQGTYTFRAYTTTMYDTEPVTVYSDGVTVVKDNVRPRNLTTPTPTNGILRYGDDVSIEFNEDIVPGYVSDKNVIVTAKLNHQPVMHDVSVHLSRRGGCAHTENPVFLNGDFSAEFWLKREGDGVVMQLGLGNNVFSLGIYDGHAVVWLAGAKITSQATVPIDEWTFFALSYKASDNTFSLLAQYGTESVALFDNEPVPIDDVNAVNYSDDNRLYLGPISACIHDLSLFKVARDVNEAAATKYQAKDNYVYGLANYWPMNEGHGSVIADTRHTHDMTLQDTWRLENVNYSLATYGGEGLTADILQCNTSRGDSYAIELWAQFNMFNGGEVLFETGSTPSNRLRLRFNAHMDVVLDYGENSQTVVSYSDFPDVELMSHYALNVVRGQSASFYFNGQRTAVIAEAAVPPIEGATLRLAQGLEGHIDEVRLWRATLSESRLLGNMYNCIDTADIYSRGLVAYYPFEKPGTIDGVATMLPTLENMAPRLAPSAPSSASAPSSSSSATVSATVPDASASGLITTPAEPAFFPTLAPLKNAPVESRLIAKPVASERKVVIQLQEGSGIKASDIEGTTLNITVDKIHDTHGNESAPIRWTTYVQQNTLKWTKDSVTIVKKYGDDHTFDIVIENRGGSTEYYTLYNMPQWLSLADAFDGSPVETTGDLDPLSTKTLRFLVNPYVAVGNYDVTIGLQGNKEILEPLRIVMSVAGEMPAWSVTPSAYENTMNLVGQIYVNGILRSNSESRVAAFINGECRGLAAPKQVRGAAYVPLTIYGTAHQEVNGRTVDLDKGQPVTFRIWDATTGVAYTNVRVTLPDGTATDTLYFDPTQSYGTFDAPVIFTKSNNVEQPFYLQQGWNWMALGVEPANARTSAVFKDLTSWNVRLKDRSTGVAYCNGVYWSGNMKDVHANMMYKLLLSRMETSAELPQPLTVVGQQVRLDETPVTLYEGWNWIAYTPTTTMTLDEALAGANPMVGDQVKSQTGFAYYGPYGWEGNLEVLESGKGYLYQSLDTQTKSFVYPRPTQQSRHTPSRPTPNPSRKGGESSGLKGTINAQPLPSLTGGVGGGSAGGGSVFSPVSPTAYPDNMSLVLMLIGADGPVLDAEVAVFVDGECRAVATADDDLYYLLIAGEGCGQPLEIRAVIDGEERTLSADLTYCSDANIGTPWEPYVISIDTATGVEAIENGTWRKDKGAGTWYTVQGMCLGSDMPTTPGVYVFRSDKRSQHGWDGRKVVVRQRNNVGD